MSLQELLTGGGGLLLAAMTLVQIAPVKLNPWSCLAKAAGNAMGLGRIEKKLDVHIETDDRRTLHFLCDCCGAKFTITDAALLAEIDRQAAEYAPQPAESGYTPSEDTVRLTNAINRGLENPEHPEDVVGLILQGISARYTCVLAQTPSMDIQRLIKEKDFDRAIQYITITADNAVTVAFK